MNVITLLRQLEVDMPNDCTSICVLFIGLFDYKVLLNAILVYQILGCFVYIKEMLIFTVFHVISVLLHGVNVKIYLWQNCL